MREADYLRKTSSMVSLWALFTCARVPATSGRSSEAAVVKHLSQAESGVPQQDLGVLEPLVVFADAEVHFVGDRLDLFEQNAGLVDVAGGILLQAEFRHLVNEFGIEEALLAWLCLRNPGLKGGKAVLIDGLIVWRKRRTQGWRALR